MRLRPPNLARRRRRPYSLDYASGTLTPSPQLIVFLQAWEGPPSFKPRQDPVNPSVWDIGYGHQCMPDHPPVTPKWCEDTLRADAAYRGVIVEDAVAGILAQNEFDALVSFVFNVGEGRADQPGKPGRDGFVRLRSGQPSTMRRLINNLDFDGAADQFAAWVKSAGRVVPGLVKRRAAERAIFVNGDYSRRP